MQQQSLILVHHLNQHLVTVVARILDNFHSLLTSFDYVDETGWLSCRYFQKKIAKELYLLWHGMSRIKSEPPAGMREARWSIWVTWPFA